MIVVRRISQIPDLSWLYNGVKNDKVGPTSRLWEVRENDCILGVFVLSNVSMISGPVIGFIPTTDMPSVSRRGWRTLRRTLSRLVRHFFAVKAYVKEDFKEGLRFARFFGLEPTGEVISDHKVFVRWLTPL